MLVPQRKSLSHALLKGLGNVIFWGNQEFGEITVHNQSPPSKGNFQAVVVSYNKSKNCLVSSLSFRATASRNGTTVTCTSKNRTSNQSLSLHIMSSESVTHFSCRYKFLMKTCIMKASIMCSLDILGQSLFLSKKSVMKVQVEVETEDPVNHFHCTLCQVSLLDTF